jgi:hypothetical protein
MIKSLMSSNSKHITVTGGLPSPTYINHGAAAQGVGNMRFNTATQNTEVFDGYNWLTLSTNNATVGLSSEAERAIEWAKDKMQEEQRLLELMEQHPGLKDLHEKLEIMKALVTQETQDAN